MCSKELEQLFSIFPGTGTEQIEYIDGIRFITFNKESDLNEYTYYEEQFKQVCSGTTSKMSTTLSTYSQSYQFKSNNTLQCNKSNQNKLFINKKLLNFNKVRIIDSVNKVKKVINRKVINNMAVNSRKVINNMAVNSKDMLQSNNYQYIMKKRKQQSNADKNLNKTKNMKKSLNDHQLTLSFRKIKNIIRFNLPAKSSIIPSISNEIDSSSYKPANAVNQLTLIEEIQSLIVDMIDYVDQNLNTNRNRQNSGCSITLLKFNNRRRIKDTHAKKICSESCGNNATLKHSEITMKRSLEENGSLEITRKRRNTDINKCKSENSRRNNGRIKETIDACIDLITIIDKFNRLEVSIRNEDTEVTLDNSEQLNYNMSISLRRYEYDWRRKLLNEIRIKSEEEKLRLYEKDIQDESVEISRLICNSVKLPIKNQRKSLSDMLIWCDAHAQYSCSCYLPVYCFRTNSLLMNTSRKFDAKAKVANKTLHFYDANEKSARTAGVLINYRARNKCAIFKKKRFKEVIDGILSATNSYVKIKFNQPQKGKSAVSKCNSADVVKLSANYTFCWKPFEICNLSSTSNQPSLNLSANCSQPPIKPLPYHLNNKPMNATGSRNNLPLLSLSKINQRNVKFKSLSKHKKIKKCVHKDKQLQMILTSKNNFKLQQLSKNITSIEEQKTKRLSEYSAIKNTSGYSSSFKKFVEVNKRWLIQNLNNIEDNSDEEFYGFDSEDIIDNSITLMKPQLNILRLQREVINNMDDTDQMKASDSNVITNFVNNDNINSNKSLINTNVQRLPSNNNSIKSVRKRKRRSRVKVDSDVKKSQLSDITNVINM